MTLLSPGVRVSVVDESQYVPSTAGTVPFVLLATASNKLNSEGVGLAVGTLPENANKLYLITSQRDLLATYGSPIFYENGNELNEYGLLAAYSALGVSNRCYVQRVDVDLSVLEGSLTRPYGSPQDGSYYLDVVNSTWGLNVWNLQTNSWQSVNPTVITDTQYLNPGTSQPLSSFGQSGQYAVVATDPTLPIYWKVPTVNLVTNPGQLAINGTWQLVGSPTWVNGIPPLVSNYGTPTFNNQTQTMQYYSPGDGGTSSISMWNMIAVTNTTIGAGAYYDGVNTQQSTIGAFVTYLANPLPQNSWYLPLIDTGSLMPTFGFLTAVNQYYPIGAYQVGPNYTIPRWRVTDGSVTNPNAVGTAPTNSVWQNTSASKTGANTVVKKYNATTKTYQTVPAPWYYNDAEANSVYDPSGGGYNIPIGTLYMQYDLYDLLTGATTSRLAYNTNRTANHRLSYRYASGITDIVGTISDAPVPGPVYAFTVLATQTGTQTLAKGVRVTFDTSSADFVEAFNQSGCPNTYAYIDTNGYVHITHTQGGTIYIQNGNSNGAIQTWMALMGISTSQQGVAYVPAISGNNVVSATSQQTPAQDELMSFSNWTALDYTPIIGDNIIVAPTDGAYWYWNDFTQADIMIQQNGSWLGYQIPVNTVRGENLQNTNPTGPIFSATAPFVQTDGTPLVVGDLWIDTSDLENYPAIYRYQGTGPTNTWVAIDKTDHTGPNGILFADARWAGNGTTNPGTDPIPTIQSLLTNNYTDLDAPDPTLYPQGILLFNTRRSSYNTKIYNNNYFNSVNFPGVGPYPAQPATWISAAPANPFGGTFMGRQSQRAVILQALKAGVDNQLVLRDEQLDINLLCCPQYPELGVNLDALNVERDDTALTIVDTPLRLTPDNIVSWATNNDGAGFPTADGLTIGSPYSATWYPSCLTTNLDGTQVLQPPSHMVLRTILTSDRENYPWIPSAGPQRGLVSNATQIGYLDANSNNFKPIAVNQGLRDVLYSNSINPFTYVPGYNIVNYGNKTITTNTSALDRINVARLVSFLRKRLGQIATQYLFEPNDEITRNSIQNAIEGLMVDLVNKRALYDYLVVCDASNNSPTTIDRNELWIDVAIEPIKSVEFIYIPVRVKSTGAIAAGA